MDVAPSARTAAAGGAGGANALLKSSVRARGAEPSKRFDQVLNGRKASAPAADTKTDAAEKSAKPDKARDAKATSKTDRKRTDEPHDDTAVEPTDAQETSPLDEAPTTDAEAAPEDSEHAAEEGESHQEQSDQPKPDAHVIDPSLLPHAVAVEAALTQGAEIAVEGAAEAAVAATTLDPNALPTDPAKAAALDPAAGAVEGEALPEATTAAKVTKVERSSDTEKGQQEGDLADARLAELKPDAAPDAAKPTAHAAAKPDAAVDPLQVAPQSTQPKVEAPAVAPQQAPVQATPEEQFAEDNHDTIVKSIRGELAKGGSVQLRLDPPSLGKINVQVTIDDAGVMSASMQTTNEEATRLLSHSLQQLKHSLESAGVSVDRIQVKQAPQSESSQQQESQTDERERQGYQDQSARQEQQRKEMLQRMWRKLGMGYEDLDLVA